MLTDSLREFLQKPRLARMSVIDPGGGPHAIRAKRDVILLRL